MLHEEFHLCLLKLYAIKHETILHFFVRSFATKV